MIEAPLAVAGALLVAIGLAGLLAGPTLVRRLIGFNIAGSGLFLLFGGLSARMPGGPDPVPQAMIITGIVVAVAATALGVALARRIGQRDG
ncbi:MAG: NADH-quinone oxidoreductase subunit K [Sphingomonadaceae bacterium]